MNAEINTGTQQGHPIATAQLQALLDAVLT